MALSSIDTPASDSVSEQTLSEVVVPDSIAHQSVQKPERHDSPAIQMEYSYKSQDAITEDSIPVQPEPLYGIVLLPPEVEPPVAQRNRDSDGVSFILCGIFLLFLVVALRFRNNIKYIVTMFHNLIETRTRQNVFDDTVRETSLIVLLNILWCACAGIIGYCVFSYLSPAVSLGHQRSIGMLWGMAIATVYTLFMWGAYESVGWVFSDKNKADLWVKGFSSSQALISPAFFLIALIAICQPGSGVGVGYAACLFFILGKLIFIWKGYRIFFNQISSWVLFLCYLCSLEIVPLILSYRCAIYIGGLL